MKVTCPHCKKGVLPKIDGNCPACGGMIGLDSVGELATVSSFARSEQQESAVPLRSSSPAAAPEKPATGSKFRDYVAAKSRYTLILGLGLAAWGAFGGSYSRRGKEIAGSDLILMGGIFAGISLVLFLVFRRKNS